MPDHQHGGRDQSEERVGHGNTATGEADYAGDHRDGDHLGEDFHGQQRHHLGHDQRADAIEQLVGIFPEDDGEIVEADIEELEFYVIGVVGEGGGGEFVGGTPQAPAPDE